MQSLAPDVVLKEMREAIAIRLQPVCSDWPSERFTGMVKRIAEITLKYDLGVISFMFDRSETEALIADLNAAAQRSESLRTRSLIS